MTSRFKKRNAAKKQKDIASKSSTALYIQCEGNTEKKYLQIICKKYNVAAEYGLKSKLPLSIPNLKMEIEEILGNGYQKDEIILIYDTENDSNQLHLFDGIKKMKNAPHLYVSSSCFEVWLVLHRKKLYNNQFINPSTRVKELQKLFPGYTKSPSKQFIEENFIPLLDYAMKNSEVLLSKANEENFFSTFTEVHLLIQFINEKS
jgi:hypothetical protein